MSRCACSLYFLYSAAVPTFAGVGWANIFALACSTQACCFSTNCTATYRGVRHGVVTTTRPPGFTDMRRYRACLYFFISYLKFVMELCTKGSPWASNTQRLPLVCNTIYFDYPASLPLPAALLRCPPGTSSSRCSPQTALLRRATDFAWPPLRA